MWGNIGKATVQVGKQIGKIVLKAIKSRAGKEVLKGVAVVGGTIATEKMTAPEAQVSAEEIKQKISLLDELLKQDKISKKEYDKRLQKVLRKI